VDIAKTVLRVIDTFHFDFQLEQVNRLGLLVGNEEAPHLYRSLGVVKSMRSCDGLVMWLVLGGECLHKFSSGNLFEDVLVKGWRMTLRWVLR
jgi:hypothetical protein